MFRIDREVVRGREYKKVGKAQLGHKRGFDWKRGVERTRSSWLREKKIRRGA